MASSRLFLLVLAALLAAPAPTPAQAREYCGDRLAGLMACRSFVFGGAAAPSPACCAAYAAVHASDEPLCLCYVEDGTFWRAAGYDVNNATGDSAMIPFTCGQITHPPIVFACEESDWNLPPYGPQGTPEPSPTTAAAVPTAQSSSPAPSGSSSSVAAAPAPAFTSPPPRTSKAKRDSSPVAAAPTFTSPPLPPTSKAKRDSSLELLMLLVAVAAVCSII